MSKEDPKLKNLLEDLNLEKYYVKFQEDETMYIDLKELTENELEKIIPKRVHRKRLVNFLESTKEEEQKKREKGESPQSECEKNEEEEHVQMKVKFGNEVKIFYEIPLGTNEELIGKLVQEFLECELKLPDKTILRKDRRRFNLEKWLKKAGMGPESEIRGVLSVNGASGDTSEERVMELEKKLEKVEKERDRKDAELKKLKKEKLALLEKVKGLESKGVVTSPEKGNHRLKLLETAHNCLWGLNGVRIDYYKPHKLYSEIVNSGGELDANANYNLGIMHGGGYGVTKDETKAKEYYKKAAEFYSTKKVDDLRPIDWKNMGWMYVWGDGFEQNRKKGIELLKKAVESGNVLAIRNLGYCYQKGWGIEESDTVVAVKLFSKAADMGFPKAMNNLGFMYSNGYGVKEDKKKALELFREAAEKGHRMAMFNVGYLYEDDGCGVEKNLEEAKRWYERASEVGHKGAKKKLEELEKK